MPEKEMYSPPPMLEAVGRRPVRCGRGTRENLLGAGGDDHVGAAAARPDRSKENGPKKILFIFLNTTCIDDKAIKSV
jgi:hypothetical protein